MRVNRQVARAIALGFLAAVCGGPSVAQGQDAQAIQPNDNRRSAGTLRDGVLRLELEIREGMYFPFGPDGRGFPAYSFAESDGPMQIPGPMIRVSIGTDVQVSIRNLIDKPAWIRGFGERRGLASDSLFVAPGETVEAQFMADTPGTFYYLGQTTAAPPFRRLSEDSQLNGAIVVDPPDIPRSRDDRIFMISMWFELDSTRLSGLADGAMAINGLAWPHTEPFELEEGDSLFWRWINPTFLTHPMHLHGFYFRVDGKGNGITYDQYAPEARRMAVTEALSPGETMAIAWSPDRPGNWIFHCHMASHVMPVSVLNALPDDRAAVHVETEAPHGGNGKPDPHAGMNHGMIGLVLGIRVAPNGEAEPPKEEARPIRLLVRSRPGIVGGYRGYAYVLGGTPEEADPEAMPVPGPTLVLNRGVRVAVTIVNQSEEPAAVHWHGIELESYADGVPFWSGSGSSLLPTIPPGDSLTVRFTPPRAGTFMYHSHFNEYQQLSSGLFGPIIVKEPEGAFDPETERILLFSDAAPTLRLARGQDPGMMLNGKTTPDPMTFRAGQTYRLRLINIRTEYPIDLELLNGDKPAEWKLLAKDGAEVPAAQATVRPAIQSFTPGEILDFTFTAPAEGDLTLRYKLGGEFRTPAGPPTEVPVRIVAASAVRSP